MTKRVIILQHAAPEGPGLISAALAAKEVEASLVRLDLGRPVPETMGDAAGLVVMGGPMGANDGGKIPFLAAEKRLIREAVDAGRPVLGICLGAQLLASTLGATVRSSGRKEIGWHEVRLRGRAQEDALFNGLEAAFTPLHWHGDVFDLPPGAEPLAFSAMTELQAFRYGARAWGLLFHLEVTRAMVEEMVGAFPGELKAAAIEPEAVLTGMALHLARAQDMGARVFRRWARLVSG
jgi:GMP synthase (glutamine-hydrolysing)